MSEQPWKPSRIEGRVLSVLLAGGPDMSGWPISLAAKVGGAHIYLILGKLEQMGWVTGTYDGHGGSGRRFYELTAEGRVSALNALGRES